MAETRDELLAEFWQLYDMEDVSDVILARMERIAETLKEAAGRSLVSLQGLGGSGLHRFFKGPFWDWMSDRGRGELLNGKGEPISEAEAYESMDGFYWLLGGVYRWTTPDGQEPGQ